jgi:glycosyltransferase involved in cell wall biosynthesis
MDFVVHEEREYAYERDVLGSGGRVLRCLEPQRPWNHFRTLSGLLRREGPYDVVHSHLQFFSGLVLAAASKAGVAHRVAHAHADAGAADRAPWRRAYSAAMRAALGRYATAGLAVSEAAANTVFGPQWRRDGRWRLLYCGIDTAPFLAAEGSRVRAELGIPGGAMVVGHVGRFEEPKNHELILRVARRVFARCPSMHLLLAGTGSLRRRIEAMALEMGMQSVTHFAGARDDVPDLLAAMDVFVFPSKYEGLGLAAVEAQAAGLPVVLSDSLPEEATVIPSLVTRVALSAGEDRWADAILAAPRPTPSLRAAGLAAVAGSRFDARVSTEALSQFYESL